MKNNLKSGHLSRAAHVHALVAKAGFKLSHIVPSVSPIFQSLVTRNTSRILNLAKNLPPCPIPSSGDSEVHVQVCQRDWLHTIWTDFSLYSCMKQKLPVIFNDDGSLSEKAIFRLKLLFPGAVIRSKNQNDEIAQSMLASFPSCLAYRVASPSAFGRKFFDPIFNAKTASVLCMDSDILFFSEPHELFENGKDPAVDIVHHCERQVEYIKCNELRERFPKMALNLNAGLTLRKIKLLDLGFLEEATQWLTHNHMRLRLRPGSDQVLMSVLASQERTMGLSDAYSNDASSFRKRKNTIVSMHFHSWSRYLMAIDGVPTFLQQRGL